MAEVLTKHFSFVSQSKLFNSKNLFPWRINILSAALRSHGCVGSCNLRADNGFRICDSIENLGRKESGFLCEFLPPREVRDQMFWRHITDGVSGPCLNAGEMVSSLREPQLQFNQSLWPKWLTRKKKLKNFTRLLINFFHEFNKKKKKKITFAPLGQKMGSRVSWLVGQRPSNIARRLVCGEASWHYSGYLCSLENDS